VRADGGCVEIGIGEDNVGALATQLEGEPFERLAGLLHDDLGRLVLTGERHLVDAGVLNDRAARGRAKAGDDVDHAVRDAGFLRQPRHAQAGERGLFGRLHHDRTPGRQCGPPFPGGHQHREIPGNDLSDHADRLAPRVAEEIAADRNRLSVNLVGPTGVVAQAIDGQRQVACFRFADRLSVVERFQRGQLAGLLLDQVGQFVDQTATVAGIHFRPGTVLEGVSRFAELGNPRLCLLPCLLSLRHHAEDKHHQ
jgi:hypothetical protein